MIQVRYAAVWPSGVSFNDRAVGQPVKTGDFTAVRSIGFSEFLNSIAVFVEDAHRDEADSLVLTNVLRI
jgi:hypothetical protein